MSIKNFIPNGLTSLNLAFGCLAIIEVFEGRLDNVIFYTMLSGVADFFDGFAARLLKSTSDIGKDLDSLADMVSFGVVPSLVMYQLIQVSAQGTYWPYLAVLITMMSGLRLAKFNNDERQSDRFFGLPTPANAFLIVSLASLSTEGIWWELVNNLTFIIGVTLATSILLVADLPMMAFKFKNFGWRGNESRYVFLGISLILVMTFQLVALPLIIVLYVLSSIVAHFFRQESE